MKPANIDYSPERDALILFIPGRNAAGHHVEISISAAGAKVLADILRERKERHRRREAVPQIGERGSPTSIMVREWLKKNSPMTNERAREARMRAKYGDELVDLELDLEID